MEDIEGRESNEYMDRTGNPSIGIGHKLTTVELGTRTIVIHKTAVAYDNGLNDFQIDSLLLQDMFTAEQTVNRMVKVDLNQNQFDSLCSLCFNIGNWNFTDSTLVRLLNMGNYESVPVQMRRWNKGKVDGKLIVIKGLVNRREDDILLWEGAWKSKSHSKDKERVV